MTMERQIPMSATALIANTGRRSVVSDDRGAIMVMGIFMCTFLVGALWYIAGIGDALIFHERLQESADSVAFSAAIIDARGMNIIVLMNLLMAAILAIRVAINLIKAVCIVLAAIFTALSFNPFGGEAFIPFIAASTEGAVDMQELDDDTRDAIDAALEGLHEAEVGVAEATPAAAWAGSYEMAEKYSDALSYIVLSGSTVGSNGYGLPIEDGTLGKLCTEAATGVADLLTAFIPSALSPVASMLQSLIVGITANDFFCELGGGDNTPPNFSSQLNSAAQTSCDGKQQKLNDDVNAAQTKLNADESTNPPPKAGDPTIAADQQSLSNAQTAQSDFDPSQCMSDTQKQQQQQQQTSQNAANAASSGSSSSGGDKTPAQVCVDSNNGCNGAWYDGIKDAQISSLGTSRDTAAKQTNYSGKFVNIAARGGNNAMGAPSTVQQLGFAQAEFYYDCSGSWTSSGCDDDQNAMWNFHWRARFRLTNYSVNLEGDGLQGYDAIMRGKIGADTGSAMSKSIGSGLRNMQSDVARGKLMAVLASQQITLH
jgi:hypothetical protein